jgi:hypothetical protein
MRAEAFGEGHNRGVAQRGAVDLNPFANRDEVRAGVESRAATVRALDRLDHRGGRALTVGTGDMETRLRVFRITDARGEEAHAIHAEARTQIT